MDIKLIKSSFFNEQETKDKLCTFIQGAKQFSIGEYCGKFEEAFANWQNRDYCVAVNSGSSANLVLVQAMINLGRLKKGDKVAFSSLTRATNPMPLIQLGLEPIPVDVAMSTLNVSLDTFKDALKTNDIKALFITNLLGRCDQSFADLETYCRDNNIMILEDNCESMGSVYRGRKLGNYSIASTFSTYVGHHMSTIEGGMVCTDDIELRDMLIMTRAHGRDRNLPSNRQEKIRDENGIDGFYSKYTFYTLGYNVRPHEIMGFLGCEQMQYLDQIVSTREINAKRFISAINNNDDFYPLAIDHMDVFSNFAIPCVCKSEDLLNHYKDTFADAGIEIRPIVGGDMTQQLFWKNIYGETSNRTNAKLIHEQGFYFGNSPEYTTEEIDYLLTLLKK